MHCADMGFCGIERKTPWAEAYTRIPPLLRENKGVKPIPLLISRDKSVRV